MNNVVNRMEASDIKVRVLIVEDAMAGRYTVSLLDTCGGPIISDSNKEAALEKFRKALNMYVTIQNIHTFQDTAKKVLSETSISHKSVDKLFMPLPELEYETVTV